MSFMSLKKTTFLLGKALIPKLPSNSSLSGSLAVGDAIQACANKAGGDSNIYYSFDLHYVSSNSTWECVQYYDSNSDATAFNVANADVSVAYGYSY